MSIFRISGRDKGELSMLWDQVNFRDFPDIPDIQDFQDFIDFLDRPDFLD